MKNGYNKIAIGLLLVFNAFTTICLSQAPLPAPFQDSYKVNYLRQWDPLAPIADAGVLVTRPIKDVKQTTQFFDGLGRVIQIIGKQESPAQNDMVGVKTYDAFGREVYKYLPFASKAVQGSDKTNDGYFKNNPYQQQQAFFQQNYPNETFYYSQSDFEASPLNRESKRFSPGNSWVGTKGAPTEHGVQVDYLNNTSADAVKIWIIGSSIGSLPFVDLIVNYSDGLLTKNVQTDEAGKQTVQFSDKDGKPVSSDGYKTNIGNGLPKFELGWSNTFTFKNFDFNFFVRGSFGHDLVNTFRAFFENSTASNIASYNVVTTKYFDPALKSQPTFSSLFVEKASFVKLDNATLGYNFNFKKEGIVKGLRAYINGQNLVVITDYTGVDPEVRYAYGNPPNVLAPGVDARDTWVYARTFTLGVNLKF